MNRTRVVLWSTIALGRPFRLFSVSFIKVVPHARR